MSGVLVTSRSFSTGDVDLVQRLADAGHAVVRGPVDHDLGALAPLLTDAAAWIAGTAPVTKAHLDLAPRLRVLARYGVGYEAVDLSAAAIRGVIVTNTPGANSSAVADHAVALMLAVLRHVPAGDRAVRSGDWSVRRGRELGSHTVGILGFGRIGQLVAQRLRGFGSPVLVDDPWATDEAVAAAGATRVNGSDLARDCDLVTLHRPGGDVVVADGWLSSARAGITLVNTARADLVDEAALAAALRAGVVAAYAADTLAGDVAGHPSGNVVGRSAGGSSSRSPLLAADLAERVVITPHVGAQTVEAIDAMGALSVADVIAVLDGQPPVHAVSPPGPPLDRKERP